MRYFDYKKSIFIFFSVLVALLCFSPICLDNSNYNQTYADSSVSIELPTKYSLYRFTGYDFDGESANLIKNVGNQKNTNICWAFASNTALESSLYKQGLVDSSISLNFSEVDLAYYTYNSRSYSTIGGGSFTLAYEYYASENGPVLEQDWESSLDWNSDENLFTSYQSALTQYSVDYSDFSVLESYKFPSRNNIISIDKKNKVDDAITQQKIADLRLSIKQHIYTYGAVTSAIYMSDYSIYSSDNQTAYYNNKTSYSANHLITLVGWDDSFDSGKGAYIAQNSYGTSWKTNGGYFYIRYDDVLVESSVCGFVRVGEKIKNKQTYSSTASSPMQDKFVTLNNGIINTSCNQFQQTTYFANVFRTVNTISQIVKQIKIPTASISTGDELNNASSSFEVSVATLTEDEYTNWTLNLANKFNNAKKVKNKYTNDYTFEARQTGYYTIDVVDEISLDNPYFIIFVTMQEGALNTAISNNEDRVISPTTYYTSSVSGNWTEYEDGETVLPMIIYTCAKETIQYEIKDNASVLYDGNYHLPQVKILTDGDLTIQYSLDNFNFYSASNIDLIGIKDVLRNENNQVISYIVYIRIFGELFETVKISCNFTIEPTTLTITPNSISKIYGDSDRPLTYKITGYVSNENDYLTKYELTREQGEDVGVYKIEQGNFKVVGQTNGKFKETNYTVYFVENVLFTITKRTLTVVPTVLSKTYGERDPVLKYDITNVVNNEVPNVNDISLTRVAGEDIKAGGYDFNMTYTANDNGNFKVDNYSIVLDTTKKFEIVCRKLQVVPDSNLKKVYGEADPVFTYTYSNNVSNETPLFSGTLSRATGNDAGKYDILLGTLQLVDNDAFKASNYEIDFQTGVKFTITNGTITGVNFGNATYVYDGQNHSLSYSTNVENLSVVYSSDQGATFTSDVPQYKDCGTYTIQAKFSKVNYDDTTLTATLTITKATITVSPKYTTNEATYGDTLNIEFVYSGNIDGEIPKFNKTSLDVENKNVGTHPIIMGDLELCDNDTFKTTNYNLKFDNSQNATLEITARTLNIVPIEDSKQYDGTINKDLTYEIDNAISTDLEQIISSLSVQLCCKDDNVFAQKYEIGYTTLSLATGTQVSKNYTLQFVSGKYFTITPAPVTIQINNVECSYGNVIDLSTLGNGTNFEIKKGQIYNSDNLNLTFSCTENGKVVTINNDTLRSSDPLGYVLSATLNNTNYDVTVLEGRYKINYLQYDVTFNVKGTVSTAKVEHFSTLQELPIGLSTNIEGYTFDGWKMDEEEKVLSNEDIFAISIEGPTNFVAQFTAISYKVYYYDNDAKQQLTEYTIENSVTLPNAQKQGYNFIGFYNNKDFFGETVTQIAKGSTGDKTFYAKFEKQTYNVSIETLEVSTSATVESTSSTIKFEEDYVFTVTLDRAYNRSYDNLEAVVEYKDNSLQSTKATKEMVDGVAFFVVENVQGNFSIKLTGIEINTYTISFVADDKVVENGEFKVKDGETLLASSFENLEIPTKEHYDDISAQWEIKEDITNVQDDMVVNAIYTPNVYTVTFLLNGEKYDVDVVYGTETDTSILLENYKLGAFEYFSFNKPIDNISQDETIEVTVGSNIFILYIILGIIVASIIAVVILNIIRQHRRKKFAWWVFGKK